MSSVVGKQRTIMLRSVAVSEGVWPFMPPRIAVFTKNRTNPAYEAARFGSDQVASRFGAQTTHYVPDEPDDVGQQLALVARAVADGVDGIVMSPVHETRMDDAIRSIEAAGIPLFHFVTRGTAGHPVCFARSDDRALAVDIARHLFVALGGRGEIVILEGTPASPTSHARMRGFRDVLAEYPGIRRRTVLPGMYQRHVARDVFGAKAQAMEGIDAVLCANDAMALGVLDVLGPAGARSKPLIVGINAVPEAVAEISAGRMLATASFDAMAMCSLATEAALRHLRGEAVPGEIVLPVDVVDAHNCAVWNVPFEKRTLPIWEQASAGA